MEICNWSGYKVESEKIKEIVEFTSSNLKNTDKVFKRGLYSTLIELVSNIIQHAYNIESPDNLWEIKLSKVEKDYEISVIDTGITIPVSVKARFNFDGLVNIEDNNDNGYIREAVTKQHINQIYRGRGLRVLQSLVEDELIKSFRIISGQGDVLFKKGDDCYPAKKTKKYYGTVVTLIFSDEISKEYINFSDDFSNCPGARFKSDGEYSGEEFREKFLEPIFDKYYKVNIVINLDGAFGFASSFLDEVFSGLAKKYGAERTLNSIEIISNDDPYLIYEITSLIQNTL